MRDIKLLTSEDNEFSIDIDIIDGYPRYLAEASQTQDQRAALAVFACKGTVPGMLDYGVSWGSVYDKTSTTIQLNNELQQQLQEYVGTASEDNMLQATTYDPMLLQSTEGIGVLVYRGGQ